MKERYGKLVCQYSGILEIYWTQEHKYSIYREIYVQDVLHRELLKENIETKEEAVKWCQDWPEGTISSALIRKREERI